ncbi:high-potential iron-sulfur protein [Granulosicoccus antarcticus]|uniref:High-potential iron-sulfur protein n=1 Tax=Granulosicoccus antarcticus IMCC3135 TaxID=1192854 RepID=A0A2Z2NQ17_9GAMM|nr:high-potential iron-sulfur protein [Granulosicoccus antarcticus]ASJ73546.1 High-potential iron-sulfur protein [Granulosicoccus antarcticus IMCC3135]
MNKTNDTANKNRRAFTKLLGMGAVFSFPLATMTSLLPRTASADSLLDPSSDSAKALQYTETSSTDNATCKACMFYQGGQEEQGGCPIFPGNEVKATGWCLTFTPKA